MLQGSWGSTENRLEPKTKPPLVILTCPNLAVKRSLHTEQLMSGYDVTLTFFQSNVKSKKKPKSVVGNPVSNPPVNLDVIFIPDSTVN